MSAKSWTSSRRKYANLSASAAYLNFNASTAPEGVVIVGNNKSGSFTGSGYADTIVTGGDDNSITNYVMSYGGNDVIYGGSGRDFIRSGAVLGANDDDVVYGGEGSDMIYGGAGNDELWGNSRNMVQAGSTLGYEFTVTAADSNARGDWISGEGGDDLIMGSRSSDVLFGGAGSTTW